MTQRLDAFIFYFDLIGVRDRFFDDPEKTMQAVRDFQRQARGKFSLSASQTCVKTLADNVWARISSAEPGGCDGVLMFASEVMRAARQHGFDSYFGVVTRGIHEFELEDRTILATGDVTEMRVQHIDMTSEPHIRAAFAEKWSADLAKTKRLPVPSPSVWVSAEAADLFPLQAPAPGGKPAFRVSSPPFDLALYPHSSGRSWPFEQSKFQAIAL